MLHSKPVISVTGTNGKGSVLAFCESILLAQGYRVGAYYSPHVFDPSERFKINGQRISGIPCDSFETMTNVAVELFNKTELDALLFEVGIGARLDPVNICVEPDVSVITNIDFDHQDKLGNTLESIGFEKAHIYRPHKPAIFGAHHIPDSVVNYAQKIQAELFCYHKNFNYKIYENQWEFSNHKIHFKNLPLPNLSIHNAAIALETLCHFSLPVSEDAVHAGLKKANLPGRFKIISEPVTQIFDVAHNPGSALLLYEKIKAFPCQGKTYAVLGMLNDKDIAGTVKPFESMVERWFVGTLNDPRAATSEAIGAHVANSVLFDDILTAYHEALSVAKKEDRIIIFGSFRTVGALCPDKN